MEPSRSKTSPDSAAEEVLSRLDSKQPVYSKLDAKGDLGKTPMEPSRSKTSPDSAAEEDLSGLDSKQPVYSELDAKSDLGKKPSEVMPWHEQLHKPLFFPKLPRVTEFSTKEDVVRSPALPPQRDPKFKSREEVWELNRKKDVVCLILSYPPFNSRNNETHRVWIRDVLEVNHKVRDLYKGGKWSASQLSSEITRLLRHSIHDIEAHVPSDILVEMCHRKFPRRTAPRKAMLDLCIGDFIIRQILQGIQIPEIRRIWISKGKYKTFLSLRPIRKMFDLVLKVNVKFCREVKYIEDRIIEEMGFSKSRKGEAEELLRSQNFLILLDDLHLWIDTHDLGNRWWNSNNIQKIAMIGIGYPRQKVPVDLEIRWEDHLLSWDLFHRNFGEIVHSSSIQQLALHVLRQCSGHLLATVLMARALKEVEDASIWQHASRVIGFLPTSHTEDIILFNALALARERLSFADKCLKYCASYLEMEGTNKVDLLERWMKDGLIGTFHEGEEIVQHLVDAFLLESFQNGESVRMTNEIHKELVNLYKAEMNPILLVELDGRGLKEAPENEAWEEANEMHLMNNKISKLPENLNCPKLRVLFLQVNHHLRVIPPLFFQYMPILQILDLSQTRIKSLPQSLFKMVQLQKFILRGCELIKELPTEVGELCHLEVLDLEGTEIINLPVAVGKLTNLTCLKVSFYPQMNHNKKNNQSNKIIPQNVITNLLQLEELSIDVNPDDERWTMTMKDMVKEICFLNGLRSLKLHLPEVIFLNDLRNELSSIKLSWMHFRFIVGNHLKRMISRLPHESAIKFEEEGEEEEESCLKYVNGESIPTKIKEVLQHATVLFLDRHSTVTSLSEFGVENIKNLKCCVLRECNEIQTIIDADDCRDVTILSLKYLSLHYMKNLSSISKASTGWRCRLSCLKALALYTCPQLTTIFTFHLVRQLHHLEELVVEDCPEINSIVTYDDLGQCPRFLPNLKKISLHYMPKLVSISYGLPIAPKLEWLSIYDCPNLKILSPEDVSGSKLKVIIGEVDWWSALKWSKSLQFQRPNVDGIFVPIERDIDLRSQLAEINDQLQVQMKETKPSQQSGPGDSLKAPGVEAGTSSQQKQVA